MAADHPATFMCTICQSEIEQTSKSLACAHTFCVKCVVELVSQETGLSVRCPNCRMEHAKSFFYLDICSVFEKSQETSNDSYATKEHCEPVDKLCLNGTTLISVDEKDKVRVQEPLQTECSVKQSDNAKQIYENKRNDFEAILATEIEKIQEAQRLSESIKNKFKKQEKQINIIHDAIVKAADEVRQSALNSLRLNMEIISTENNSKIEKQLKRVSDLLQIKKQIENAQTPGQEKDILETAISKYKRPLKDPENVALELLVLRSSGTWVEIKENIKECIGVVEVTTVNTSKEEMMPDFTFDRETLCESFCEIQSVSHVVASSENLAIFYVAEGGKEGAVEVSETGKVLVHHDTIHVEQYRNCKRFNNGQLLQPIQERGVTSTYSRSTKEIHFRLNSGLTGKGKVRKANLSSDPLNIKGKTVMQIGCGRHKTFDVSEDGKCFVVLEEPESPRESGKVRIFTKKNIPYGSLYEPPQLPFKPADIILYHLEGRQYLLIADEASDSIHVVDLRGNHLVFLRKLALGPYLLSQPVALHVDSSDKLWVTCRGVVYAFRPNNQLTKKTTALQTVLQGHQSGAFYHMGSATKEILEAVKSAELSRIPSQKGGFHKSSFNAKK